ncbi:toll/interleukin-1 receptor domain-containing protein [Paenibacillus pasadenensis]|uniref:toll/interleukin-1 receptor domain-containing protein n=1 Tax=Paenibacillus pasadenensis TaxID=217090 RepID=UPI002041BCC7|nr:toll/interleukin-1 receptor domain-containing protein [Paenibacillus pasadenensis]MCM3748104.1 toll/interleukin-1 receptor domain-containing protein [Paenibacillus pasadenensis]
MALYYGCSVFVTKGKFKGRIGYFDDDEVDEHDQHIGFVSIGHPLYSREYEIPMDSLREITTEDLYKRQGDIQKKMFEMKYLKTKISEKSKVDLLTEFIYIESLFSDKYFKARFMSEGTGKKIFISHSSLDKPMARLLATDLVEAGHCPWLDEWQIKIGESIPGSISNALMDSDFVLVLLSKNSLESLWVEQEWQSKYWDEINEKKVKILPVLLEDCKIPELLKTKKYADFRDDYEKGLRELLISLEYWR